MAIEIDWRTAAVKDGTLTVELSDKPPSDWSARLENVIAQLHAGTWGQVEVGRRRLKVAGLSPGVEEDLRHFLDSALLQANSTLEDDDEPVAEEGPDAEMTATFRAFAG